MIKLSSLSVSDVMCGDDETPLDFENDHLLYDGTCSSADQMLLNAFIVWTNHYTNPSHGKTFD